MPLEIRRAWGAFVLALAVLVFGQPAAIAQTNDVKALIAQLSDKNESKRLQAAKELGRLKGQAREAISALTIALSDPDEDVRNVAKKSLAAIRDDLGLANEKLEALMKSLKSRDVKTCLTAIEKLRELGPDAKLAGPALVEYGMMHESRQVREAASIAFERIDPLVHKEVLTFLIDEDMQRKATALTMLQGMGPKARAAIPAIKSRYAFELKGMAMQPGKPNLAYLEALAAIGPSDPSIQLEILGLVGTPDWEQGDTGPLGPRPTVIKLMHSLKVTNKQKFNALASGLSVAKFYRPLLIAEIGKLGADAKAALPGLMKLKFDPDLAVREAAGAAVEAIKDAKE